MADEGDVLTACAGGTASVESAGERVVVVVAGGGAGAVLSGVSSASNSQGHSLICVWVGWLIGLR